MFPVPRYTVAAKYKYFLYFGNERRSILKMVVLVGFVWDWYHTFLFLTLTGDSKVVHFVALFFKFSVIILIYEVVEKNSEQNYLINELGTT